MATAASKLNSAYWRKRTLQQAERQIQADEKLNQDIAREYKRILHELDQELAVFYARYAQNESISMAEARRLLKDAELEDFRMSLDEFRAKAIAGGYDKELNEIYLRTRVSRLQALQTQLELRVQALFQSQEEQLHDHLAEVYTDTYYQTVYTVSQQAAVRTSFARINTELLEHILAQPWLDSDFSSRIWADRDKLLRELKQELSRAFVLGEPLQKTTKRFAERMGVSERRAETLVQTESAHMAAQATAKGYEETGVGEYQFDASLDLKTCPTCRAMDGKSFRLPERETGVNYPPLHPRCRCTTVPVTEFDMDGPRAARNPVTGKRELVEQGMTYAEWHKKYVDGDMVDKSTKSAIMEAKTGENGEKSVDNEQSTYRSLGELKADYLEKRFGKLQTKELIIMDERLEHIRQRHPEDVEFFEKYGAASALDPDIVLVDEKHEGTVFMIKGLPETNLNVVTRLALDIDDADRKNSIMTFYRLRDKNLQKLMNKSEMLYKKE
ncbi:minor capsid protein [Agathobaculum desmolans]|uniref:minor capsid protein n=2 Tax=Agathobaculum desmolans TaxID=39484 RepID=UPI00068A945C|nr:minor capsid protein [Agathobaculum desmolans]